MVMLLYLANTLCYPSSFLFGSDIDQAVKYIFTEFTQACVAEASLFSLSIAAPEVIRYSYFQNFLETKSLELLYVEYGTDGADFSIGPFQMKPSFVEELEQQVLVNPMLVEYQAITKFSTNEINKTREIRIERIQQPKFQIMYLSAFRAYCEYRYSSYLQQISTEEKLRFIATVYNLGFGKSTQSILDYLPQQNFPYGANYPGTQHAYGQLAVDIYHALIKNQHANSKAQ